MQNQAPSLTTQLNQNIFELSTEGIIITDVQGTVLRCNKALCHIHEFTEDEINSHNYAEFLVPAEAAVFRQHLAMAQERKSSDVILTGLRKNGSRMTVRAKADLVTGESIEFIIHFIQDISIQTQNEEEMQAVFKELSRKTEELQRKNVELENFTAIASHDLHAPLNTIISFIDYLNGKYLDTFNDEARLFFSRIHDAALRMKELISDLLEFATVASLEKSEVDLEKLLTEILYDMTDELEISGAVIKREGILPTIIGSATGFRQLFQNLIANSIKYRDDTRPPEILIHSRVSDPGKPWKIIIQDNGMGFDNHFAGDIFLPFNRLKPQSKLKGSGIGLATVKKIVELHGGSIIADGVEKKGATFTITLPPVENEENISFF